MKPEQADPYNTTQVAAYRGWMDRPCLVAKGGLKSPPRSQQSSGIRFNSHSVVHGGPKLLLASEVTLRRLNGYVAKQKPDLVEFSTSKVAQAGARAAEIMRC